MRVHLFLLLVFVIACIPHQGNGQGTDDFDLQGHRGARGLLPENTVDGFLRALELGVTTLEMDAVVTADGQVVLSHEPWFSSAICSLPSGERVPKERERDYRIYEMSYAEVTRFDCGRLGNPAFPRQETRAASKPLLSDVIQAAEAYAVEHDLPGVQYNIETKSRPSWDGVFHPDAATFARRVLEVVADAGVLQRTTLQSFDVRTLQAARNLEPDLRLSLLVSRTGSQGLSSDLETLGFRPDVYSPDYRLVDRDLVDETHHLGILVIPWTVNDADDMLRLRDLGVDGLITDYPDVAARVLAR